MLEDHSTASAASDEVPPKDTDGDGLGLTPEIGDITSRLQQIVDDASQTLGRPIAIDDRHHRLLVYSEHPVEEVDPIRLASILRQPASPDLLTWLWEHGVRTATGAVRVKANEGIGLQARVCVPIRSQTHLLGFFWLLDPDESIGQPELRRAEELADDAGVILYREIMLRDLDRGREREFMRDILSQDERVRAHAVEHLAEFDLLTSQGPSVVLAVSLFGESGAVAPEVWRLALDAALMRARRKLAPKHALHLLRPDHALMLVSMSDPLIRMHGVLEFAARVQQEVMRSVDHDGARCIVAVGGRAAVLEDAIGSHRQALRAVAVAEAVSSFGDVVDWEQLGVYRVLAELAVDRLGLDDIHPGLRDVLSDSRLHPLVQTVECYLDNAGDAQATSNQLFVHRTSLYHRLRKFEQATNLSLASGEDRLILHLSLKLARLQGFSWSSAGAPSRTP